MPLPPRPPDFLDIPELVPSRPPLPPPPIPNIPPTGGAALPPPPPPNMPPPPMGGPNAPPMGAPPPDMGPAPLDMPPPMDVPPPPPPVPPLIPAERPAPTKDFQEKAFEYIAAFCKSAAQYVQNKKAHWKLLDALYNSAIGIREWSEWRSLGGKSLSQSRKESPILDSSLADSEDEAWQSNYIHSPGFIVDNIVDNLFSQIFAGNQWIVVVSTTNNPNPDDAQGWPTAYKLQKLLIEKLEQSQVHCRIYEAIQSCVKFGTVYAKIFWSRKEVPKSQWAITLAGPIKVETKDVIYEAPIIQLIPLDKILPDVRASHNDIQRWAGIGHRVSRRWEEIEEAFESGVYDLNKAEALKRFKEAKQEPAEEDSLYFDPDANVEVDKSSWVEVWEWHGRVPYKGALKECVATILTEPGAEDPESGILVRLQDAPALDVGLRPFVCAHFTPQPGPFGMGIIEREEGLLYQISQFIAQAQDNARLTSNPIFQCDMSSPAWQTLKEAGNRLVPGLILPRLPGDQAGFEAVKLAPFPSQEISNMVQFLSLMLEKHTSVADVRLGMSEREKTATEASILEKRGNVSIRTRLEMFARSFINPAAQICLAMLQQFITEDQSIQMVDAQGKVVPLTITTEEIQNGNYKAYSTLVVPDSSSIAKAQSIERIIPILSNLQPMLGATGTQINFVELVQRYLAMLGIENADRILRRMTPMEAQAHAMATAMPQGGQGSKLGGRAPGAAPGPPAPPSGGPGDFSPPVGPPIPPPPNQGPPRLVEKGGPMGPEPNDINANAQLLQLLAQMGAPKP